MKKWIPIIVVISMLGWAVYDFIESDKELSKSLGNINDGQQVGKNKESGENGGAESPVSGLEVGNKAPDFQLQTLSGETVKISDYRGKRVMINFWATWCPPCRAEMPDMEKFYQNKDIVILAINLKENREGIEKFAKEYKLNFPILLDESSDIANLYKIQPIPTSYMVDSRGIIRYKALGAMNYDLMVQEFEKMK